MTTLPTDGPYGGGPPPNRDLGEVNHRYTLLSYVGHGGMGIVFRARDRLTGDTVALKRMTEAALQEASNHRALASAHTTGSEARRRLALAREFRTVAALRHPNIISVLDYGFATNGGPFFTMELVERPRTLLDAAHDLSTSQKVDLLIQVLRALSYLHRRGVIHRDLKPSNVLVGDRVRVVDFGIALQRGDGERPSGTLSHMAPEVLRGERCGEAADLYAMGIMGYETFVGRHPFRGFVGDALHRAVLTIEPDVEELPASPALRDVFRRLLFKDPAKRYSSADEVIDALIDAAKLTAPRHTRATRESFLQAADFVGRLDEQRALLGAVDNVMSGRGGVWLVEGESGIGKTRLLDEIRTMALVGGAKVVRGQANSHARDAFDMWREPLRHLLLGTDIDEAEASTLLPLVPDVAELLGRPVVQSCAESQTAGAQMLEAIGAIFERQRAPVLLILEDLHWAREGLDVLRELAPRLPALPVLIIGSFRCEEAPGLASTFSGVSHIRLGPLARGDISALAGSMLGRARQPVVEFLDRHTEGNVFFLVEAVRALAEESGSLDRVGDSPLPERLVTSGIDSVVARRLAKIPVTARPVLDWSAMIGRTLEPQLLEEVFGAARVSEALAIGTEIAVLEVRDNSFRFAHDKFREHALDALDPACKPDLHAEIAAAIERYYGDGRVRAAALAYHYHEAGIPEREAPFSALAGQAALEQGAYGDAARLLERATVLYETSPAANRMAMLDCLLHYGAVLRGTQSWATPEVKRVYDRAIEVAVEMGAHERTIPALHGLALWSLFGGDLTTASEYAVRYGKMAEDAKDLCGLIQAALILANVATWLGHHDEAEPHHRRVIDLYDPDQLGVHMSRYGWDPRVAASVSHAASTCIRGDPDRAVQMYREALAAAEATDHPFAIAIALQNGAWVHYLRREVAETLHYAERLAELARRHKFLVFISLADAFAGWAMVHTGQIAHGLDRLRSAVATQRRISGLATTLLAAQLADGCLAAGAVDEAIQVVRRTLRDQITTQERCYHPELYRLLGEAWRTKGNARQARTVWTRARDLAVAQRARLFELRVLASMDCLS
jgi:tetratricopeptide (TPR) repeat protein/tRNA A-37 threonylcarbamoyl transferase component Bud32